MAKILTGKVISVKMQNTAVVEVSRRVPHPLYKKLLKKGKHFNVDTVGQTVAVGNEVRIIETKPISKTKYFAIKEVITKK
ncbi:MAG TPA: 30S ribosomal protein S17 [Candidatus Acidoferrales bacterium]|nr:30S ribosomal protein S17 [Candidatus Acidoferrales bacterium]